MQSLILYKRLLKYAKPHWKLIVVMLIAAAIYSSSNAAYVAQLKGIIDEGFVNKDMQIIYHTVGIVVLVTFFRGLGFFVSKYLSTRVSSDIVLVIRQEMFAKLQQLPAKYYDRENSGQTLSLFNYHVSQVTTAATGAAITLAREGVMVIVALVYLFYQNWKLTLLIFALTPIMAVVIRVISKRLRLLAKRIQGNVGTMNHILDENIKGQKIVKIYNGSAHEQRKFQHAVRQIRNSSIKSVVATASSTPIIELLIVCMICFIIVLMAWQAKDGALTPGEFLTYTIMMGLLPSPIKKLMGINAALQSGLAASEEIFAFLDEAAEPVAKVTEPTPAATRFRGDLRFERVFFSYLEDNEDAAVLHDFSLHIRAGETVALVGASGSGKSSVAALIPRFYEPTQGQIYLDDQPIAALDLALLRQQIAFVNQDTILFDDSVAHNIAYGAEADSERVKRAAQLAQAESFILDMDEGYDSPIGEAGQRLSGGQKQRLAIARALYKDAPILILDEATSALDSQSERLVQQALDELMHDRTAIVIAHRLSTVRNADRIVVLDKGRIIESGSHDELMAKKGRFYYLNQSMKGTTAQ